MKLFPHSGQTNSPLALAVADVGVRDGLAELFFRAALFERALAIVRLSLDVVVR